MYPFAMLLVSTHFAAPHSQIDRPKPGPASTRPDAKETTKVLLPIISLTGAIFERFDSFSVLDKNISVTVTGAQNGRLSRMCLEKRDDKGAIETRLEGKVAHIDIDLGTLQFLVYMQDINFCLESGGIKGWAHSSTIRIALFPRPN